MRRRLATLAAVSALALALSASPALASSPAQHLTLLATEAGYLGAPAVIDCGAIYTATSGTFEIVTRVDMATGNPIYSASGNAVLTGTITARKIVVEDEDGNEYRMIGSEHYTQTYNAQTGTVSWTDWIGNPYSQGVNTYKFQLASQEGGGTVGSVNLVLHASPNGNSVSFDFGVCTLS